MNQRLSLAAIAEHLRAQPALEGVHVGTGYDHDYLTEFGKRWPAVWIGAQRLRRITDGDGLSGYYLQDCNVDVVFRIVVQRYAAGDVSPEAALNSLHDALSSILCQYQPAGADSRFVWDSGQDGECSESVMTADLVFTCRVTYQGPAP